MTFSQPLTLALMVVPLVGALKTTACESTPDVREVVTDGGSYYVTYVPDPDPIPVQERFALDVDVAYASDPNNLVEDAQLAVDAWMPAHGHGMDVVPRVSAHGDGTFRVENMEFSMSGEWEILMDVTRGSLTEQASFLVQCCQ